MFKLRSREVIGFSLNHNIDGLARLQKAKKLTKRPATSEPPARDNPFEPPEPNQQLQSEINTSSPPVRAIAHI